MMSLSRSLIFFADGSQETQTALSQIVLRHRKESLVTLFLSRARHALQEEYLKLSQISQKGLPDFRSLSQLVRQADDVDLPHPALHPPEIILVQLALFIAAYEQRPDEPYPDSNSNLIVGICFGELSATAVSLAKSLIELVPLAVEAVRVAFKAGIAASTVGDELEYRTVPQESWSISISRDTGLSDNDALETLCAQIGISEHKRPFVTTLSRNSVVLGGPPSSLRKLISYLDGEVKKPSSRSRQRIAIYAPYHASRLYSQDSIRNILDHSPSVLQIFNNHTFSGDQRTLIGGVTGDFNSASSRFDLLNNVLYNILAQPIYWEKVVDGCLSNLKTLSWVVRPFGPTASAQSLASTLGKRGNAHVIYDGAFGSGAEQSLAGKNVPIAVIGMAGRFPSADSPDALWKVFENGLDCHQEVPIHRFNAQTHLKAPTFGCFIQEPGMFDAQFFNMSPREALQTDPGQRLALVTAYEALEMSGCVLGRTPSTQSERIGTFYGQTSDEYKEQNMAQDIGTYFIPGTMRAFGPGRINRYFKLGGPSLSVDTACSSSSVALHAACNSIWTGECDTAIVGGMNIISSSDNYIGLNAGHFLSPSGGCKTFDEGADGYCRGEAVASVVIKKLDAAQADNDNILSIILSTATNYSAESTSITHPHGPSQENLYKKVLHEAGIRAVEVDYVEMHGTGTQAGDTVEMSSVTNVFAPLNPRRPDGKPLYLGASKANVGHGESASGITALIKAILVLRGEALPPHIGIKGALNHRFPDLEKRNVCIPFSATDFHSLLSQGGRRHVLVNNFSAAGGNAACVLEEYPRRVQDADNADPRPNHVVSVTAKSKYSLYKNARNLIDYLDSGSEFSLSDLSYTTTVRRMQHPLRVQVVASTLIQLRERLASVIAEKSFPMYPKVTSVYFVFTGQGSIYTSIGQALFEASSQFRSDLTRFDQISQAHGFPTFLPVVNGHSQDREAFTPFQMQLGLVAVQMGLCRLLESWGVKPGLVIGHSLGEYSALYASGVLTASDTLYLVGRRAGLLEAGCTIGTHSMLTINAATSTIREALGDTIEGLEFACVNGPYDSVLSGPAELLQRAEKTLKYRGFKSSTLSVPYAFHSSQMDSILTSLENVAQTVEFREPKVPVASPILGIIIRHSGIIGPSYLRRHARECVDFCKALNQLRAEGLVNANCAWVEIGHHPMCLNMIRDTLGNEIPLLPTLRRNENSWASICKSLSLLHTRGYDIGWKEYHRDFERGQRLLSVPSYAFEEKNYWIEYNGWLLNRNAPPNGASVISSGCDAGPRTTTVQRQIFQETIDDKLLLVFETNLVDSAMYSIIAGHVIHGSCLCPASVYADIALTIADHVRKTHKFKISTAGMNVTKMEILQPIIVPKTEPRKAHILRISSLTDLVNGMIQLEYSVVSTEMKKKGPNAKCIVKYGDGERWLSEWSITAHLVKKNIEDLQRGLNHGSTHRIFRKMAYKLFASLVQYSDEFQGMHEVLLDSDRYESAAWLKLYAGNDVGSFFCNPLWIDTFVHLAGFVLNADAVDSPDDVYISHGWESMRIATIIEPSKQYHVHVKMQPSGKTMFSGNVTIFDDDSMVGLVEGLKFQKVPRSSLDVLLCPVSVSDMILPAQVSLNQRPPIKVTRREEPFVGAIYENVSTVSVKKSLFDKTFNIIADEIGISPADLKDDIEFYALGVDSLLSLTILSRLREVLQIDLPNTVFQDYPNVGDLRRYLQRDTAVSDISTNGVTPASSSIGGEPINLSEAEANGKGTFGLDSITAGVLTSESGENSTIDSLSTPKIGRSTNTGISRDFRPLLAAGSDSVSATPTNLPLLQTPDSTKHDHLNSKQRCISISLLQGDPTLASKILFLFPDGSGSATSYGNLPKLPLNICLFGLNSPALGAGPGVVFSIEDLVASWVMELQSRQPSGPYSLAGWSAGGYYAFEAAKKLLEAGEIVQDLILIDSPPRNVYESLSPALLEFISKNGILSGDRNTTPPQWLLEHFTATLKAVDDYIPSPITVSGPLNVCIIWASDGVMENLDTSEQSIDLSPNVTRFLLQRKTDFSPRGWDKLLPRDEILIAKTSGNHFDMVKAPNSELLARLVTDALLGERSSQMWILWKPA